MQTNPAPRGFPAANPLDTVRKSRRHKLRQKIGLATASNADRDKDKEKDKSIKEKEKDIRGVINIQFAVITPDDSDALRFAVDTGRDVFHMKAASAAERDEWVAVLNESKKYFSSLVEKAALRALRHAESAASPTETSKADPTTTQNTPPEWPNSVNGNYANVNDSSTSSDSLTRKPIRDSAAAHASIQGFDSAADGAPSSAQVATEISMAAAGAPGIGLVHLKEFSVDGSQIEDDGVAEAAFSRKALVLELRRVCAVLENGSIADVFDEETASGGGPAAGLRDLATWMLHVLRTDEVMFERRLDAAVHRARAREVVDDEDDPDWDTNSDEFYDALSRTNSSFVTTGGDAGPGSTNATSVTRMEPKPVRVGDMESKQMDENTAPTSSSQNRPPVDPGRKSVAVTEGKPKHLKPFVIRTHLPRLSSPVPKLNVWGILKDSVGRDLSKISIPVALNEPISFLQRLAEDIEYSELLDQAAQEPDPYRRLMLVATMIVSHYSSTQGRTGKPFNPLLGETYSLDAPHKGRGVKFLAEQVCHHPPISACYAESAKGSWKYYNAIEVKNKFWGKSLEVFPTGWNHVEIPEYGDHFEFEQVTACVHNIVIGKLWLDNYGDMVITNRKSQDRCIVSFVKSGWFSDAKTFGTISGIVYDSNDRVKAKFSGRWTDAVYEDCRDKTRKLLWQASERPPLSDSNDYNMTKWAITLNQQLPADQLDSVAPSDSRFRPDQRALEDGMYDLAGQYKNALEEGQRARRKLREAANEDWTPRWFDLLTDPASGRKEYMYNGKYFNTSESENRWKDVPDLYSCATAPPSDMTRERSSS